jgi:prepilin-type N-terminal cleavage/methylation domain-containing protein
MMNDEVKAEGVIEQEAGRIMNDEAKGGPRRRRPSSFILHPSSCRRRGFTLIEMLIVVAIMVVLASLTFPILGAVKRNMIRTRARGSLVQTQTAIEAYKDKFGHYPPDNGGLYSTNQLYYELLGTTNVPASPAYYQMLDGSAIIRNPDVHTAFVNVSGFINCCRPGNADDAPTGMSFIKEGGLKANQFGKMSFNGIECTVMGVALDGPLALPTTSNGQRFNPWCYNSSNPVHNPKSFDLWIDVYVGGKTNRICNWSDEPFLVYYPTSGLYPGLYP